jgi:hypothetical protein
MRRPPAPDTTARVAIARSGRWRLQGRAGNLDSWTLPKAAGGATIRAEERMARLAIRSYTARWYPGSNRARLVLHVEDDRSRDVPVESAAELAALIALLAGSPVYLEDDGSIVHERTIG